MEQKIIKTIVLAVKEVYDIEIKISDISLKKFAF